MSTNAHRRRVEDALEGSAENPPVAGLSFVPAEAFAGGRADPVGDPAESLAAAVRDLRLDFAFVQGDETWAADAVAGLHRDQHAVFWVVDGPLWPVLVALGPSEALKATAWDPTRLDGEIGGETARGQEQVLAGAALGVDAIVIPDDLCGSSGPLVAPDYFNEHLVERYALLAATAASVGVRAVFHSDGDIRVFLPGLARAGFIGVHGGGGLGQEGFEYLYVAARDQGLAMLGGIDTVMLEQGRAAAVRMGTRAGMMASSGGLLVCDDGGITSADEFETLGVALQAAGVGS